MVDTTRDNQRAEKDLKAQTEMARWAFWMLVATIIIAVITGLGVYYVWGTLKATQQMAIDTKRLGEAQSRPYIRVCATIEDFSVGKKPRFIVVIENVGTTPAKKLSTQIHFGISQAQQIKGLTFKGLPINNRIDLYPGQSHVICDRRMKLPFEQAIVSGIQAESYHMYAVGIVSYKSIFRNNFGNFSRHKTVFRFASRKDFIKPGTFPLSEYYLNNYST